jgi:hypothetical protein
VVPPNLGRALFDQFPGTKRLWIEEGAGHNTLDYDPAQPRWREILAFLLPRTRSADPGPASGQGR